MSKIVVKQENVQNKFYQSSDERENLSSTEIKPVSNRVLEWYDRHRRVLPWRALAGQGADPYHVWLSEIMLQQTVVAAVIPYFVKFVEKWPTVDDLAAAAQDEILKEWAGLGYYARARNLHKCAQMVAAEYDGRFPDTEGALKKLPGIGDYTSAAITAIAFKKPAVVVDGNIERVISRYFAITDPLPDAKTDIKKKAALLSGQDHAQARPGDYAQALMDLGAAICIPKAPRCALCPLSEDCQAKEQGIAASLPAKRAKKPKPFKCGYIYWLQNHKGQVLLEKRPDKGLLGGMTAFPTSDWHETNIRHGGKKAALADILPDMRHIDQLSPETLTVKENIYVMHSFTHFDLKLFAVIAVYQGDIKDNQFWADMNGLENEALPTVFKKFVRLMSDDV